ncbi:MAG TPA: hypothetical protein DD415_04090 [Clostridiales bacterium]|nr:hypothetical protein [Clostridiales bacterium]
MKVKKSISEIAGKNLKRLIKTSKYKTQEEFAYCFGTDVRTVSRWVNNGINNLDTLQEIAEFLGIEVLELLND